MKSSIVIVKVKKQCTKCKRILSNLDFHKNKRTNDGLQGWCKECVSKHYKEMCAKLKLEVMIIFGKRCSHVEDGIQCSKDILNNLEDLELSHPNGDGNKHRDLISRGRTGCRFYKALKERNWYTDGYVVEIRCRAHHRSLDCSGKKHYSYGKYGGLSPYYKTGKFNDPDWLKKKYAVMTLNTLAKECGVSVSTILSRMDEFNIPRRKTGKR